MKKMMISAAGLVAMAACATTVPVGFDGNASGVGNAIPLVIPSVPQAVPPPAPVTTSSLDGPAYAPTPLPSTNGMAPPPVEVGVVGPIPEALPTFTPMPVTPTTGSTSAPLVMDEDM